MNHGYCKNCWWWEPIEFDIKECKYVLGVCWMWCNQTRDECYCPDYWNRKKGNKEWEPLESWVKSRPATYERPEGSRLVPGRGWVGVDG